LARLRILKEAAEELGDESEREGYGRVLLDEYEDHSRAPGYWRDRLK
jgi:hypothetical protein